MVQNSAEPEGVDPHQLMALEMLMTGKSQTDIAKDMKVHRNTVARWMDEPGIKEERHALTNTYREQMRSRMLQLVLNSVEALEEGIDPSNANQAKPWLALAILKQFGEEFLEPHLNAPPVLKAEEYTTPSTDMLHELQEWLKTIPSDPPASP